MLQLQDASHTCIVMCMEWVLKKFFFFQRNILTGSFLFFLQNISFPLFFFKLHFVSLLLYTLNHLSIRFPSCFILWILFQFVFPFYIKGTIIEKYNLNFFREFFQSLKVLQPNLRNPPWILLENSFNFFFFFRFPTQF